jgi:phosphonoacetate hydrolase
VPSPNRDLPVRTGTGPVADRDRALTVLLDPALAHVVDLVAWPDGAEIHVANSEGEAAVDRTDPDRGFVTIRGRNPVADQDPLHATPLAAVLADPSPPAARNAYPFAARRLISAFGDPDRSPDLYVVHSARHHWPERGGHLGEHGSLDAGQSRAPLLLSGAGVTLTGVVDAAVRVVDIGPTLAALAGCAMPGTDGRVLTEYLCAAGSPGPRPTAVVGMLWDGTNCNDLIDLAQQGELPAVARLLERGGTLRGGALAEFPSVTLVNHTSALTGVGPGRHGIVGNVYFDRATGRQVLANDSATWHRAGELLRPGVCTVFEVVAASGRASACVNEPTDRGADYSTFGLIRSAGNSDGARSLRSALPDPADDPHATAEWVRENGDYAWSSQVDAFGLAQMRQIFGGDNPQWPSPPLLTWWNTTLTDSVHHAGGPYSEIARDGLADADRRLGAFLDLLDARGLLESTAFLLTADHGSEGADPACTGDWDEALRAAGINFRDEGYGSIYLGVGARV